MESISVWTITNAPQKEKPWSRTSESRPKSYAGTVCLTPPPPPDGEKAGS